MYNNKRYNFVINYARPKILKCTRNIYLKRPLKIKARIGSNSQSYQMFKILEKQSFINISRVSLSSPKYKKMHFQQNVQNFYWAKTQ